MCVCVYMRVCARSCVPSLFLAHPFPWQTGTGEGSQSQLGHCSYCSVPRDKMPSNTKQLCCEQPRSRAGRGNPRTWGAWKGETGGASWWQEANSEEQTSVNSRRLSGKREQGTYGQNAYTFIFFYFIFTTFLPPTVVTSEYERKRNHTGVWQHLEVSRLGAFLLRGQRPGDSWGWRTKPSFLTVIVEDFRLDMGPKV